MAMAGHTKDRILDVAETLFADNGFAATSLRDITHEAGVNIAAVNYHFGSKDALLGAVFERRSLFTGAMRRSKTVEAGLRSGRQTGRAMARDRQPFLVHCEHRAR